MKIYRVLLQSRLLHKPFLNSHNVKDNPGAITIKKRLGRGERSGKGKTSGRGQKGWKARASKSRPVPGFEGGQTGILKASPQMGQTINPLVKYMQVSMDTLQYWVNRKKLDATKEIGVKDIYNLRVLKNFRQGLYLSEKGLKFFNIENMNITVQRIHPKAAEKIESLGGTVTTRYYSQRDLRAMFKPELFVKLPSENQLPPDWKTLKEYVQEENRGYLSPSKTGETVAETVKRILERVQRKTTVVENEKKI